MSPPEEERGQTDGADSTTAGEGEGSEGKKDLKSWYANRGKMARERRTFSLKNAILHLVER